MKAFMEPLKASGEWNSIREDILKNVFPVALDGCTDEQKCHQIFSLSRDFRNTLIITYSDTKAGELLSGLGFFDEKASLYPSKDLIFFSADVHGNLLVKERARIIRKLMDKEPVTVITTMDALLDKVLPLKDLEDDLITVSPGMEIDPEDLEAALVNMGFIRCHQVESPGEFAVRGGIVDIFNVSDEYPYRIEFFDTEVDSVRIFDSVSQRTIENAESFTVYPAAEYVFTEEERDRAEEAIRRSLEKSLASFRDKELFEERNRLNMTISAFMEEFREAYDGTNIDSFISFFDKSFASFLDYFSEDDTIIWVDEPKRSEEMIKAVSDEFTESMGNRITGGYILPEQADVLFDPGEIFSRLKDRKLMLISSLYRRCRTFKEESLHHINVRALDSFSGSFSLFTKDILRKEKQGFRTVLVSSSRTRGERMAQDLRELGINAFFTSDRDRVPSPGEVVVLKGDLARGMEYPFIKFAIYSESDIFGEKKKKRRTKEKYHGERISSFSSVNPGDLVVHVNHGLGIYRGIENLEVDGSSRDYIKIEYANNGALFIPAAQLDLIQKYTGAGGKKPKLNSLYSQEWNKTKERVRGAVKELAGELVDLYARRQAREGYSFSRDTVWQKEFEEEFPYVETKDQLTAINDTKSDMESTRIMDRLICGDVGYGKTEVAIRAAFKAVQDGKQVAMLVPTTILAQQHYNTFKERFGSFPVNIDMLCRFRTKKEQEEAVKRLKSGALDIVIGTHRLLSKDVGFKDLGLLIIDEEQRFGVSHKEKIKQIKTDVDVLTLTATPIPRTLHMGLSGIRDMSLLEEPPEDRLPVQTYVLEFNPEIIREAILREVKRGGQVYFVYNNVASIMDMTSFISGLVPDVTVEYAHGQMKESLLSDIMYRFINREIDVLVSTTIIETGLDIPNVNTMIINDADKMGLAQMYQLRGRIGRSSRTAYAFLMFKRDKIIKEVADKRLKAIREFTDLGSGFKLAMRDLEIRGAGNLLGAQQSGHMEAVGYDLYCEMLKKAIKEQKGEKETEEFQTEIDVAVDAFIPDTYIKNESLRLDTYKRISLISTREDADEIFDELTDRFGDVPSAVSNLMEIAVIKEHAHSAYISSIKHNSREMVITMYKNAPVDINKIPPLLEKYTGQLTFKNVNTPYFIYRPFGDDLKDPLKCELSVINDFKGLLLKNE